MKDKPRRQPSKEPESYRQRVEKSKGSQYEPTAAGDKSHGAGIGARLDILDILDALPFYVLLVDEEHFIIEANSAVKTQLGVEPKDIIGKYCPKVIHDLDGPFPGCPLEESVETGLATEWEFLDEKSGRWLNSAIYPIRGWTQDKKRVYFHMVTDITERKQAEEQVSSLVEQFQSLATYLESVREEERKKLARNLHDDTSQTLVSLSAYIKTALNVLPTSTNEAKAILEKAEALSAHTLDAIHKIIYELRPMLLDDFGLVSATRALIENTLKGQSIKVRVKVIGKERRLPSSIETALFRVVQEATQNIVRHAHSQNASVSLYFQKNGIRVCVRDNGIGFNVEEAIRSKDRPRGLGLLGMKERVELVKGTFSIHSRPGGGGTEINVSIPC
jgi:PAS domain S-box-containing protein